MPSGSNARKGKKGFQRLRRKPVTPREVHVPRMVRIEGFGEVDVADDRIRRAMAFLDSTGRAHGQKPIEIDSSEDKGGAA